MIRSLRRKFLMIAVASMLGAMAVLCIAIGIGNHWATTRRLDRAIALLRQNGGSFFAPGSRFDPSDFRFQVTPETPFETRYCIVEFSAQGDVRAVYLEHIAALDSRTVMDTVRAVLQTEKPRGYVGHYRYGVFDEADGGVTVIVLDCFLQLQAANNLLYIVVGMFLLFALIVTVLLLVLSKQAIRPFIDNLERQRQFVTDASHELKTPLAILSADMGLLEDTCGKNEWTESARAQIGRLKKLTRDLVELARTEETVAPDTMERFSLTEVARAHVDAFQPLAEADGKTLEADIPDGIYLKGVEDNFFRLFSILLDNAVKYCDAAGTIRLHVSQKGRNVCVSVSNPCAGVDPAQMPRWFDRFYRADSSRARATGGYGIGLSTAHAIAARHKGRITNRYANGVVTFLAVFPSGS